VSTPHAGWQYPLAANCSHKTSDGTRDLQAPQSGRLNGVGVVPRLRTDAPQFQHVEAQIDRRPQNRVIEQSEADACNPDVHATESTAKNKSLDCKWVPLVKMLKAWNRHAGNPIEPSFLVEVMAQGLVDGPFKSYPSEVRRFFAAALDGVNQEWPDPAGYGPPVSDQMTSEKRMTAAVALRKAEVDATRAVRFEKEGRQGEALALWRDILGRYFPSA
jgi:hypothetical protein